MGTSVGMLMRRVDGGEEGRRRGREGKEIAKEEMLRDGKFGEHFGVVHFQHP